MLSLANVGGSRDAGHYYEQADDYYTQGQSPSLWQGESATLLGLHGEVGQEDFKRLLDGNLPNGRVIQVAAAGRRGGTDLTFSAPKSVSMQALIGGDLRLTLAHDRAVTRALKYAETLASYRQTVDHETKSLVSGNMVAATFRHELSRACDPQLHTHSVVLNMTRRLDGQWRAMDNELFFRQKMLLGALYRAELAREVQHLGYDVRITHADGRFELAHIEDHQLEGFSQRSQAIEEALQKKGLTRETASSQEKQILAIATRPRKTDVDRKVLRNYWHEKSREYGIQYKVDLRPKKFMGSVPVVTFAVNHLTERQSAMTRPQILREALQHGVGRNTFDEINTEIQRRIKTSVLVASGEKLTTPELIQTEAQILEFERRGRNKCRPIVPTDELLQSLQSKGLNDGQKNAVTMMLTTQHRVSGIQGLAGTGKTFMLRCATELVHQKGYTILGLAPSASAADELQKSGIPSRTIAAFQTDREQTLSSKMILVVDEAGMVSSSQMKSILKSAHKARARVVLVGDTRQLKAVEAGKPFAQLQTGGMTTAGMSVIQRQKNPELKKAVMLAARGQIPESLSVIDKTVSEIKSVDLRYTRIADAYSTLPEKERSKTLIVCGTNEARRAINHKVRSNLGLNHRGWQVPTLEARDLTKAQIKETKSYRVGDLMKAERPYSSMGMSKGSLAQIQEIKRSYVVLKREDGHLVKWNPKLKNKVSIYEQSTKEMASGEIVCLTRNDPQKQFRNGDRAKLIGIDDKQNLHLKKEDGKIIKLDRSKPLHLEYGYCSTVHSAQGKTCDRVLIEADTKSLTSAQDNYYVAISRARHEVKIYTDNKQRLPVAMSRVNEKESALEVNRNDRTATFTSKIQELSQSRES